MIPASTIPCCEHCEHSGIFNHASICPACLRNAGQQLIECVDARIRAELRDRLDRCTDHDHGAAFGWLADNHPDLVREALDETGAPS